MEMKMIIVLTALIVSTAEASYFVWRRQQNQKVKPTTCKLQELTQPALKWSFSADLSCNADEIVDIHAGEGATNAAVGLECAFTYSCPLDPPGPHRRSSLVCGDNGKWEGDMPDCTQDENMASSIFDIFREGLLLTEEEEEPAEKKEEATTTLATEVENSTEQQSKQNSETLSKFAKLTSLCNPNLCSQIRSQSGCKNIIPQSTRPHFMPQMTKMFAGLCYFCYKTQCKRATVLL